MYLKKQIGYGSFRETCLIRYLYRFQYIQLTTIFGAKFWLVIKWRNYSSYQPNIFRVGNHMSWVSKTLDTFVLAGILVKIWYSIWCALGVRFLGGTRYYWYLPLIVHITSLLFSWCTSVIEFGCLKNQSFLFHLFRGGGSEERWNLFIFWK